MHILKAGGILMYVILFFGMIGLYAAIERFFYFALKERNNYSKLPTEVKHLLGKGDIKEAIVFLNNNKSSTSTVLKEILVYGYKENKESLSSLEEKGKEKAIEQIKYLERNMWLISMAAHTSPLLGLLGTVTGMIKAFQSISVHGTGDAGVLALGISEALYTTAGGLIVAIPCMILYNYFNKKIDIIISDIEKTSTEMLNCFRD
ncbi:MotA/TolQ/ExbB proton channel family protein [Fusobacterium sp.]|uniref:MotA/TolQ/ExbB proton channel family protein n=1 Tax=Fusobacterium TaxID=848 RepID=UPI0025C21327|nr:MotA/TolQ/ExbB proton channel family protein [Fusobacterium sp.]MCI5724413.1 MotA/TolQ/ExbB proton channel family protein [Fusobacterium sp.]MCI7224476.1 MotA/TolQ/ExbB proton channel family protein [Fusobacterium sp.]MDD7391912.1 MotA/TolQ/ExbB proton channel family protein [Fusobacteriaceae bacterium]MDY5794473.1 MotA/TolQ/ExbB proton channel family protein [Fusobacterium gastrosuis]